ncbi:MFS transporter [Cystobacter ferrugineus]|uniref:MFS transporter n=1 Tax=Cystobacter ferrugineus TaxID=83449 RepID=A0A1L9B2S4_9BACT|nr:MFS transporter [Cystobacter ferrugineus]OJH36568.1 MFS transporter [Cystobacter ferrugineus]
MILQGTETGYPRHVHRMAAGALFFLQGVCFASWASRIPTIQQRLGLTEAALGLVLLALPAGSMAALPAAGWWVSRKGSALVALTALVVYAAGLVGLGFVDSLPVLLGVLFVFGFTGNVVNISVNTQAVGVEALYGRSVMASFHGLWSLAGFVAAGIGAGMIGAGVAPLPHFLGMGLFMLAVLAACSRFLLTDAPDEGAGQRVFVMPDRELLGLGLMAFCSMICEGAMFDWSGVYFARVVGAEPDWVGAGYAAFMAMMASGRFLADGLTRRFGLRRVFQTSGVLITVGLALAVGLPRLPTALLGFMLVGLGVSSVVPLVYGAAGRSRTMSPGAALAAVSSIGFLGFLVGPPLIGLVAGVATLRGSFTLIAMLGLGVAVLGSRRPA